MSNCRTGPSLRRLNLSIPPLPLALQVVNIVKMYPKADCSAFDCLGRVYAGTIKVRRRHERRISRPQGFKSRV